MTDIAYEACAYENALTLYWDKPEQATANTRYRVEVDGTDKQVCVTDTFVTVDGLEPGHGYTVTLSMACDGEEFTELATARFHTVERKRCIDVTAEPYCAVGDGCTVNTQAIQRALDDCGPGDSVHIPAGVFLTGALFMHSDSELYIEQGGMLQGTANPSDYEPWVASRFEGVERRCYASLINIGQLDHTQGYTTRHVRILGQGSILGGGAALMRATIEEQRERLREELAAMADYVATCENEDTIPGRARGRLIAVSNAQDVLISGLTLGHGASWNVHMTYSDHVVTHGCHIVSEGVWNGDGWDPDSSTNCVLFDTQFSTGDDMVAIKSGKNPEGNRIGRPTKHIRIFGCSSDQGHGIAIGSEMSGGIEDVRIWDCDVSHSRNGINIKSTVKRGGYVRDVSVRDCVVAAVCIHSVTYNDDGEPAGEVPILEGFRFERLAILGRYWGQGGDIHQTDAIQIEGFDEPGHEIRDVVFCDCRLGGVPDGSGTVELSQVHDVTFERIEAGTNTLVMAAS